MRDRLALSVFPYPTHAENHRGEDLPGRGVTRGEPNPSDYPGRVECGPGYPVKQTLTFQEYEDFRRAIHLYPDRTK